MAEVPGIKGYAAKGLGDQCIIVGPDLDLIVVAQCGHSTTFQYPEQLLMNFILPSILS